MSDIAADELNYDNPTGDKQGKEEAAEQEIGRQLMYAAALIKSAQKNRQTPKPTFPSASQLTAPALPTATTLPPGVQDALQLAEIANQAHDNLFESKPIKPIMTIFRDRYSITIDRQKLTISHRNLFKALQTTSVQNRDIINVQAELGPLYGTLVITSKHYLNNVQTAKYLRRQDVIRARRLIQGLIIASSAKIDITDIDTTQLIELLMDLGRENRSAK